MLAVYESLQFDNNACSDNNPSTKILHNNNNLTGATRKRYQCTECEKGFSRPSALQTHMYTHTKEKPFKCDVRGCDRSFSVVSNLRRHFKVHRKQSNCDKLSPEDRMRCVRRHIREAEAFLAAEQAMSLANMHYATSNSSSSSCSSSNSSVSSISSSSSTNGLDSLNNVNGGVKRLYFLDEPIHDDFDFALLSPIAYDAPPSSSFKAYVLEPCSSL